MQKYSPSRIFQSLSEHFGFNVKDLVQRDTKSRSVVHVRNVASYVFREQGYSYPFIGREFRKNHVTIMNGAKKVASDEKTLQEATQILGQLNAYEDGPSIVDVKPIPTKRYGNSSKWWKFFQEYEARCQICGFDDFVEIHHVIPLKNGGSDHMSNLLLLCPTHHEMLHRGLLKIVRPKPLRRIVNAVNCGVNSQNAQHS